MFQKLFRKMSQGFVDSEPADGGDAQRENSPSASLAARMLTAPSALMQLSQAEAQVVVRYIVKTEFLLGLACSIVDTIQVDQFGHVQEKLAELIINLEVVKSSLVKIDSVHTYVNGNAGWDWADFHVTPTDGKTKPFTFAILFLWSKVHGEWICKGDYFMNGSFRSGKLGATH